MTPSDDITERLKAANPIPNVNSLVPATADATEFLAVLKETDVSEIEAPTTRLLDRRGDDLTVFEFSQPDEGAAPKAHKGWVRVAATAAATIIVVLGVVVVADRNRGEVEPGPALTPTVTVPPTAAEDVIPEPESADPGRCEEAVAGQAAVIERLPGWLQVCEPASFAEAVMYSVVAGGPGLVAVGGDDQGCCTQQFHGYGKEDALEQAVPPFADAIVWTSPDGLTWARVPQDETAFGGDGVQQMFSVTVGGPGLVAVGRDGLGVDGNGSAAVWTSVDGLTWSRVPHDEAVFGGPGEQRMVSVTDGGPGLVAVGRDGPTGNEQSVAAVWTSVDGLTWSRVPHDEIVFGGADSQRMLSVIAGGPGLVAVGSDGHTADEDFHRIDESLADAAVWTSVDGLTWSRGTHDEAVLGGPGEQRMDGVTVGGPGLVAVGSVIRNGPSEGPPLRYAAAVWTSPDGLTWSRVTHDEAVFGGPGGLGGRMLSVAAGGPGLVAVGTTGGISNQVWTESVWTSPDGVTWSRLHPDKCCGYEEMVSVTAGGPGLVAVGSEPCPCGYLGYTEWTAAVWVTSLDNGSGQPLPRRGD